MALGNLPRPFLVYFSKKSTCSFKIKFDSNEARNIDLSSLFLNGFTNGITLFQINTKQEGGSVNTD